MKHLFVIMLFVLGLTTFGDAQETVTSTAPIASKVTTEIIAASSTKVVKGAPFSAEAVSESTQVLADGNKIVRTLTTKMFRDNEGRFRREGVGSTGGSFLGGSGGLITGGTYVAGFGLQDTISIFDPVEGIRYILNPSSKTARRFSVKEATTEGAVIVNGQPMGQGIRTQIETNAAQRSQVIVLPSTSSTSSAGKTESLGTRTIEGVQAEGTRIVTTIAAGAIGNEREIEIVYERWYSKELDLIVYSRHYDPRFGEQIYRLTNINRNEPDRSLFTVPSDFKVITEMPYKVVTTTKPQ